MLTSTRDTAERKDVVRLARTVASGCWPPFVENRAAARTPGTRNRTLDLKLWCLLCAGLTSPFAGCGEVETDRLGEHSGGAEFSASSSPARTEDRRALDAPQNESGQVVVEASIQKALQRQRIRREQDLRWERERARRSQEEARYQQEQDRQRPMRRLQEESRSREEVSRRKQERRRLDEARRSQELARRRQGRRRMEEARARR